MNPDILYIVKKLNLQPGNILIVKAEDPRSIALQLVHAPGLKGCAEIPIICLHLGEDITQVSREVLEHALERVKKEGESTLSV